MHGATIKVDHLCKHLEVRGCNTFEGKVEKFVGELTLRKIANPVEIEIGPSRL